MVIGAVFGNQGGKFQAVWTGGTTETGFANSARIGNFPELCRFDSRKVLLWLSLPRLGSLLLFMIIYACKGKPPYVFVSEFRISY